jgi:surfeit locus 1 family protein
VSTLRSGLRGPIAAFAALAAFAVLMGLGTWQIERKAWKEALIATLSQRLAAPPVELPPPEEWATLTRENAEFLRVRLRAELQSGAEALVYTSGSPLRDDVKAPGYFVFTPARLASGRQVVINRGYVPDRTAPPSGAGPVDIVGAIRWPEAPSWFIGSHDSGGRTWHVRDPRLMAEVKGWGPVAPFYIEQEAPVPPGGLPHPSALSVRLRNDHLQYALTWYGLAAVLAVMGGMMVLRTRRRAPQPPQL